MGTTYKTKALLVIGVTSVALLTSACMPSKIQERIDETEKKNEQIESEKPLEITENTPPEDIELSREQKEILDSLDKVTPEAAINANELERRDEVSIEVPTERSVFKNEQEFSQYVSYLLFMYHTDQITAKAFHKKLSPHFHEDFLELLPTLMDDQIRTFEVLQEQFLLHLPSPIVDYKVTNVEINTRSNEASFYRKYELKDGTKIYYMTYLRQSDNGQWFIADDKPAPPYEKYKAEQKMKNTEEE